MLRRFRTMEPITRRQFISTAAGAAAAGVVLAACSSGSKNGPKRSAPQPRPNRGIGNPAEAPFDTVVVLMLENRSFDHRRGWMPGARGKQAGLSYADSAGKSHPTWPIAPDWQGWHYDDPMHDWRSVARQLNHGANDGFLKTQKLGDTYPISYYTEKDLPVVAKLARSYTTLDQYFCSIAGATWPNRFYMHCAATDVDETSIWPDLAHANEVLAPKFVRPSKLQLAIWDRLPAKGVTRRYSYNSEPMTGLFPSRQYEAISYRYNQFKADAAAGKLPNVAFLDPEYGATPEVTGTSHDFHPHGSVKVGDAYIGEVYDILRRSPQWERMVFVLTFDEHGGFYDHVTPPLVRDDNVNPNPGPHPNYKQLGYRVPCIVMGPF